MFYNRGEVISDQFDHFQVIGFRKKIGKNEIIWEFFLEGGGVSYSQMYMSEYWQKVNIFVETKNAPWGLKRKINHKNFFWTRGSQKGGVGVAIWE